MGGHRRGGKMPEIQYWVPRLGVWEGTFRQTSLHSSWGVLESHTRNMRAGPWPDSVTKMSVCELPTAYHWRAGSPCGVRLVFLMLKKKATVAVYHHPPSPKQTSPIGPPVSLIWRLGHASGRRTDGLSSRGDLSCLTSSMSDFRGVLPL